MVSGTQHEIDLLLLHTGFPAVKTALPAALIIFAAALDHGKVTIRCFVIERLGGLEILYQILRAQAIE